MLSAGHGRPASLLHGRGPRVLFLEPFLYEGMKFGEIIGLVHG
jgi:hypothetical protein